MPILILFCLEKDIVFAILIPLFLLYFLSSPEAISEKLNSLFICINLLLISELIRKNFFHGSNIFIMLIAIKSIF